jgi:hypothetical protein
MRGMSLLCVLAFLCNRLSAQYVYTIKADSVKITNCDSSELIVENHTQNVPGFLFNTGNGRTIFKRGLQRLNDSLYLIGADTLKTLSKAWVQGGNFFGTTGVLGTLDSNHLDLYTNNRQNARLTSAGDFLLGGTTDNGSRLQVYGPSYFNGSQVITGNVTGTADPTIHSLYMPSVTAGPGEFALGVGARMMPTLTPADHYQNLYALDITPIYRLNGYVQHPDGISPALHVNSRLGGMTIDQDSSYTGSSGQPLCINQTGTSDKEAIRNYRNGNLTGHSFIWNLDNRPSAGETLIVPAIRSTISAPQAGAGVSFTLDRYYYGTEVSIDMRYETTPDSTANRNTSIAFNTITSSLGFGTPLYINGNNIGMGTKVPTAQLHTTGTVRFAGLGSDNTKTRVLVGDANGNLFYRDASTLAANDLIRSSLAVNGPITAEKLTLSVQDWPDYVFDSTYQLPALVSIEKYIRQHHHLPGLPSAAAAEKNGTDVGETQAALLKKIEEMTLYTIEQDKKLVEQKNEIENLKQKMERLEQLINIRLQKTSGNRIR